MKPLPLIQNCVAEVTFSHTVNLAESRRYFVNEFQRDHGLTFTYLQSAELTTVLSPPAGGLTPGFKALEKKVLKVLYFVKSGSASSGNDSWRL